MNCVPLRLKRILDYPTVFQSIVFLKVSFVAESKRFGLCWTTPLALSDQVGKTLIPDLRYLTAAR